MTNSGLQPVVLAINFVLRVVSFSIGTVQFWRKLLIAPLVEVES